MVCPKGMCVFACALQVWDIDHLCYSYNCQASFMYLERHVVGLHVDVILHAVTCSWQCGAGVWLCMDIQS